jgi:hypothetical protein
MENGDNKMNLYSVCNRGFAGDLFTHYVDGREARFPTLEEAIEVAKLLPRGVVLFRSQSVWSYLD